MDMRREGHPFQCGSSNSLFVFQVSVRTDKGKGLLSKQRTDVDKGDGGGG